MALVERDSGGDAEVKVGGVKAWADRQNWPASWRRCMDSRNFEAVAEFIGRAIAAYRRKYYDDEGLAKLSEWNGKGHEQLAAAWQHSTWRWAPLLRTIPPARGRRRWPHAGWNSRSARVAAIRKFERE